MSPQSRRLTIAVACTCAALLVIPVAVARAQDCPADVCDAPNRVYCDAGGFAIRLVSYLPANTANSGMATYVYEVCSPALGVCQGAPRAGEACRDHNFCRRKGQEENPAATCSRGCAVDSFRDLSHFDVGLPQLGLSCLGQNTVITGSCTGGPFTVGPDGSCGSVFVAKCDQTNLLPGQCLRMTINIPGELNRPGLGETFSISKESQDCNSRCVLGPACDNLCDEEPEGDECLTRTRGFWGTHPHLIAGEDPRSLDLLPITVCGTSVTVTAAGVCSTSEALCTSNADRTSNPTYLTLAAQLTAAKLNLKATRKVTGTQGCHEWEFDGLGIRDWIAYCETNFCGATKQQISESGCIEALNAFNNSLDTGFDETPAPFDRPGPAEPAQCQAARGNKIFVGSGGCAQPAP